MNPKRVYAITVLIGLLSSPLVLAQGQYDYQLFAYPGAVATQVFGINSQGLVAGTAFDGVVDFPFVYDSKKNVFADVAPVAGFSATVVTGIADSGTLVVAVTSLDESARYGLIINRQGSATVFAHPDAVSFTQARGVNNKGQVAGYRDSADDVFAPQNGFIYDSKTGQFTDVVPSLFTIAQGINNKGEVVGSAVFFSNEAPCATTQSPIARFGWLRQTNGNVLFFTVNDRPTSARGITDSGTVAGFLATDVGLRGFVTPLDGSQCQYIAVSNADLLAVDDTSVAAASINNAGVVTGTSDDAAFLATPIPPRKGKK